MSNYIHDTLAIEEARKMWLAGLGGIRIGNMLGVPTGTVNKWIKKFKVAHPEGRTATYIPTFNHARD